MSKALLFILILASGLFVSASAIEISLQKKSSRQDNVINNSNSANTDVVENKSVIANVFENLLLKSDGNEKKLLGENENQIAFLFLGIGGEEHVSGDYLTDTIILSVFIPATKKMAVISIPRDLLVRSPKNNAYTRINALYAMDQSKKGFPGPMGIEFILDKIQEITGISPRYYLVLDLLAVEKIVDMLGGIYLKKDQDLADNRFPDNNYGYETYKVNEGWRFLSGKDAVKYIRTRHTIGGDFDRMKRQQEVARAIKKKAEGLKSVTGLPKLLSIYKTLQNHLATNLELGDITRLMNLAEGLKEEKIIFETITAETGGLLAYYKIELGGKQASVLKPRAGIENYEEIKNKIRNIITELDQ